LDLVAPAEQVAHCLDTLAENFANGLVDRARPEILGPCNLETTEIGSFRRRESRGIDLVAQRIDRVLTGLCTQKLARVGDRASHRAEYRDGRPTHGAHGVRHEA